MAPVMVICDFGVCRTGVGERDAVLLQGERQLHVDTEAVDQERADIDFSGIAGHDGIEAERGAEIFAADIQGRGAIGERDGAVAQIELADGEIDDGLEGGLIAFPGHFGCGHVGASVGSHDDIGLGLLHQQIGDIDEASKGREQFQIDLHQVGAEKRRGAGGLQTMQHEVTDLRAQVGPVEGEGTDLDASAGSLSTAATIFSRTMLRNQSVRTMAMPATKSTRIRPSRPPPVHRGYASCGCFDGVIERPLS